MTNPIDYVGCSNAQLVFYTADGTPNRCSTIAEGVEVVQTYGFAETVYFSSSMDFADEEGFADRREARLMFDLIVDEVKNLTASKMEQ